MFKKEKKGEAMTTSFFNKITPKSINKRKTMRGLLMASVLGVMALPLTAQTWKPIGSGGGGGGSNVNTNVIACQVDILQSRNTIVPEDITVFYTMYGGGGSSYTQTPGQDGQYVTNANGAPIEITAGQTLDIYVGGGGGGGGSSAILVAGSVVAIANGGAGGNGGGGGSTTGGAGNRNGDTGQFGRGGDSGSQATGGSLTSRGTSCTGSTQCGSGGGTAGGDGSAYRTAQAPSPATGGRGTGATGRGIGGQRGSVPLSYMATSCYL